jgi:arylsulfatase A-like enzyme
MDPNIIFILLDGARWDRLHVSKEFQEIIQDGFLLTNVTSAMPYTFGAMNVIFTGKHGKENGVDGYYKVLGLKDSIKYLPEILQKNGYFTSKGTIHETIISSRGFNLNKTYNENVDNPTKINLEVIKKSFKLANGKPIFCFFQYSRIHTMTVSEVLKKYEWDDDKFYNSKQKNLKKFDSVFKEAGIHAKIIKEYIEKIGKSDETIIVFFADHGTGIGERFGERNYGSYTYEETIRTFFLFLGKKFKQNSMSDKLLTTLSIFPTLLDFCGITPEGKGHKKSLVPFLSGKNDEVEEKYVFSETGALHGKYPSPEKSNVFCIKTSKFKLIYLKTPNEWELYNIENDSQEKNNIFNTGLKIEKELTKKLLDHINR